MTDELDPQDREIARLLAELPVVDDPATFERARIAYRNSRTARRNQRRLYRHGMRLATVAAVSVFTGSLVAGYAAALPDPVQRAAHHIFGRVGVPAPQHHHRAQSLREPSRPLPRTTVKYRATVPVHHHKPVRPHDLGPRLLLADHGRETAGATTTAVILVDANRAARPVRVHLQSATSRTGPWQPLPSRSRNQNGRLTVTLPAFPHNTWLRAVSGNRMGAPQLLVITPTIRATWSRSPDGHLTLQLEVHGAASGDTVTIADSSRHATATRRVVLNRHGAATLTFTTAPPATDRLTVQIAATTRHGATVTTLPPPPAR